jgi:4-hydroxythreonine-4-phosphate dehydrogenase
MKPVIAITSGDPNGIGPEVVLKSLLNPSVQRSVRVLLVGPLEAFRYYARSVDFPLPILPLEQYRSYQDACGAKDSVACVDTGRLRVIRPGRVSGEAGSAARRAIESAVSLVRVGLADAIVTAPVSKAALNRAGVPFPGQTEMLQYLTGSPSVAMMLVCQKLRVGLVTIHLPLRAVAHSLSRELVREKVGVIHESLLHDWGIREPKLALLALNPHAGEKGNFGDEERRILEPAVEALRKRGMRLEGPFPADGFFAHYRSGAYDAVVALYHDQGLIPLKMLARGKGVNFSAGLPLVRTSPDHGTAFAIAGRGKAEAASTIESVRLAAFLAARRHARKHRRGQ